MGQNTEEKTAGPVRWESPPYEVEVNFGLSPSRKVALKPELLTVLHETFIDHPDYDAEHLQEFLRADLYLRVFHGRELTGIFLADLVRMENQPVLYLVAGFVLPKRRSGGTLMTLTTSLALDLAAQAFGSDEFFVAMRSANPRVVAGLWKMDWVRFYPRLNWEENDPRLAEIAPHFCSQVFGTDRCEPEGRIFYNIYPVAPWHGNTPWHHDEKVNNFCRRHLGPDGRNAFLFLGPTLPPLKGMVRGQVTWPMQPR
jgi:hypothetical protein